MEKAILEKYKKAGEIVKKVKKFIPSLIKDGALLVDIADKVEEKIASLGGKPAFPVDVSVNGIAAHYAPIYQDKSKLKKGDLVKVDLGVHIDGYVVDTAISLSVGKNKLNEDLINTAKKALAAGISKVKPGVEISEISKAIELELKKSGFQSVRNLRGHSIDRWEIHAGTTIPNYEIKNSGKLKEGMVIAIEPFPTTGEGVVVSGKGSEVYQIIKDKTIRQGRDVLEWIKKEYHTLPFCKRNIIKKFGTLKGNLAVRQLLQQEIIHEYAILREKTNGKVAQAEHTIIVLKKPIVLT